MPSLKEIVEIRLSELGLGPVEAAVHGGIERTFIRDIVEDKKKSVRSDKMAALAHALRLDPAALARNEMVRLNDPGKRKLVSTFDPDADSADDDRGAQGYTREHWHAHVDGAVPEIDVKLGAGEGIIGEVINIPVGDQATYGHRVVAEWLIPQQYLRNEAKTSQNHTVVMEVVGDSMQPNFLPGDRVIVDLSQNQMLSDGVYAFSDGISAPQIKRFQRIHFTDPVEIEIVSDNPSYKTLTVELSRVIIIGRVCGHITRK